MILTLFRLGKYNAFSTKIMLELEEPFGMFDIDDRVKCIILTGQGVDLEQRFVGSQGPINEHWDG